MGVNDHISLWEWSHVCHISTDGWVVLIAIYIRGLEFDSWHSIKKKKLHISLSKLDVFSELPWFGAVVWQSGNFRPSNSEIFDRITRESNKRKAVMACERLGWTKRQLWVPHLGDQAPNTRSDPHGFLFTTLVNSSLHNTVFSPASKHNGRSSY